VAVTFFTIHQCVTGGWNQMLQLMLVVICLLLI